MRIVVALKHVPLRIEVDALTGAVDTTEREAGLSYADQAALEWALLIAEAWGGAVEVISVGPVAADGILRDALAAGAGRAARVEAPLDTSSAQVAAAVAAFARGADLVLCGDYSLDRGSGSVPAFIAAEMGVGQALGLVGITAGVAGNLDVIRRLDGGRRELLTVAGPAVLSVEGSTARLRRGSLKASLAATRARIEVVGETAASHEPTVAARRAYRPRARVVPPPSGATALDRIRSVTAPIGSGTGRSDPIELSAAEAAATIIDALARWGYTDAI
jgi:electron transfer flavoprotein beta subunit